MARKKKGRARKNNVHQRVEDEEITRAPHTFVFTRGQVGLTTQQLALDVRKVMEPYTATNLQARKHNILKDFVAIAGPLHVTHFVMFSKTVGGVNMRIARLPKGPTLHFKVHKYCLKKDIESSLKKPKSSERQYKNPPLLVLNDFKKDFNASRSLDITNPHKLCATMLQNMFPSININKLNLNAVKRCVLFNYDATTNLIEFRHYNIAVKPVGMSRRMKKFAYQETVPNMSKYNDISEYLLAQGEGSASESEQDMEDPNSKVLLPQKMFGHGNMKNSQSAIRLTELGPRMTLELFKIEEGLCEGEVIYHSRITKTESEKQALREVVRKKKKSKLKRKAVQDENVKKKQMEKEEHKKRCLAGMQRNLLQNEEIDDDAKWYKEEVGEEFDEDLVGDEPPTKKKVKTAVKTKSIVNKKKQPKISTASKKKLKHKV